MGVNQSHEATRTAQAIINLALMTGNIGRPGTGAPSHRAAWDRFDSAWNALDRPRRSGGSNRMVHELRAALRRRRALRAGFVGAAAVLLCAALAVAPSGRKARGDRAHRPGLAAHRGGAARRFGGKAEDGRRNRGRFQRALSPRGPAARRGAFQGGQERAAPLRRPGRRPGGARRRHGILGGPAGRRGRRPGHGRPRGPGPGGGRGERTGARAADARLRGRGKPRDRQGRCHPGDPPSSAPRRARWTGAWPGSAPSWNFPPRR